MKKLLWLLPAALLVMGVVFMGCPVEDQGDYEVGQEAEQFNLNSWLKATGATVGVLSDDQGDWFKGSVLKSAGAIPGDVKIEVIETPDGELGLKIETVANWGPGVDFRNAGVKYAEGYVIKMTGEVENGDAWMLDMGAGGAEKALGKVIFEDEFDEEFEMTADEAKAAAGANPACLRLNCKSPSGGDILKLYSLTITGARPLMPDRVTSIAGVPGSIVKGLEASITPTLFPETAMVNPKFDPEEKAKVEADGGTYDIAQWLTSDGKWPQIVWEFGGGVEGVARWVPDVAFDPEHPADLTYTILPTKTGQIKLKATVKGGKLNDVNSEKGGEDFVQDFIIEVINPPLLPAKIGGASASLEIYPGKFSWNDDFSIEDFGEVTGGGITYSVPNGYNAWVYFPIDLGTKSPSQISAIDIALIMDEDGKGTFATYKNINFAFSATKPTAKGSEITGVYHGPDGDDDGLLTVTCSTGSGSSVATTGEVWGSLEVSAATGTIITIKSIEIKFN